MVAISSQYSFGADKAVQISQAVIFDKGTQPELRQKTDIRVFIMNDYFGLKLSEKLTLLYFLSTRNRFFCLEILTFKMVIKV